MNRRQFLESAAAVASVGHWGVFGHGLHDDATGDSRLPSVRHTPLGNSADVLDPHAVDLGPFLRRRGLVFVDGKRLAPVEHRGYPVTTSDQKSF